MKNLYKIKDELYIVSSSEKIKENTQSFKQGLNGDWFYNTIYNFIARTGDITPYDFKIILTTNKLLIKDGVQDIDDEFLEWFVENPSCEEVGVKLKQHFQADKLKRENLLNGVYHSYKIIIPKEEPKQETLEEAAEKHLQKWRLLNNIHLSNILHAERCKNDFMAGAKWQQDKNKYSDEDMREAFKIGHKCARQGSYNNITEQEEFDKWFEQFKNK